MAKGRIEVLEIVSFSICTGAEDMCFNFSSFKFYNPYLH